MPRPDAFLQHNLVQFRESVLNPLLELPWVPGEVERPLVDQRTALTIEAIRWAHLGIALDFLPADETTRVLEAQWSFMVHNLDDFIRRREVHFESGFFTTGRELLSNGDSMAMLVDPCMLRAIFQQLLMEISVANRDFAEQGFSAAVNFTAPLDWENLMNSGVDDDSLAFPSIRTPFVSALGIARSLNFMSEVRQTAELSLRSLEVEEADAYAFVRTVSKIVRWRFSIHLPAVHERFVEAAEQMFRMVQGILNLPPVSSARLTYLERLRGLLQEWRSWGRSANTLSP
jgi:hypothetical protein